jgi:cysteine desulfurase
MKRIYLDYNATTPLSSQARAAMEPYLEPGLGNASSVHAEGRKARAAVDDTRDVVAAWLGAKPHEIIFTSGGTESNNLAVQGLARAQLTKGRHLVTCQTEHHAVLQTFEALAREGFAVTYVPVSAQGVIDLNFLEKTLRADTTLVSVMTANNETGVCQPVPEIAAWCAERGVAFHTDAVQTAGKRELPWRDKGVTALSVTAHKFYGPLGAGVLVLRAGVPVHKLMFGGAHENERRPGTENVPALAGLAAAVREIQALDLGAEEKRQVRWMAALWEGLKSLPGIKRNGGEVEHLGNTLNVSVRGLDGEDVLMGLDLAGLAVSSGSACLVGSVQSSHVLAAMGVVEEVAQATVRFSIGRHTADEDVNEVIQRVRSVVERQQALA